MYCISCGVKVLRDCLSLLHFSPLAEIKILAQSRPGHGQRIGSISIAGLGSHCLGAWDISNLVNKTNYQGQYYRELFVVQKLKANKERAQRYHFITLPEESHQFHNNSIVHLSFYNSCHHHMAS